MAEILSPYTPELNRPPSWFEQSQLELERIADKESLGLVGGADLLRRGEVLENRERWGANARRAGVFALADERLTGVLAGLRETSRPLDYITELTRGDKLAHETEADVWGERRFRNNPDFPRSTYQGIVEVYVADALEDIKDAVREDAPPAHEGWQWDIRGAVRALDAEEEGRLAAEPESDGPNHLEEAVVGLTEAQRQTAEAVARLAEQNRLAEERRAVDERARVAAETARAARGPEPAARHPDIEAQREELRRAYELVQDGRMTNDEYQARLEAFMGVASLRNRREMYVRMMYDRSLYGRWQPEQAPLWFRELSMNEQRVEESKLQLARAAFAKSVNAGQAEKIIEAQGDAFLVVEQMKTLYELPGVKPAMEWYVHKMLTGEPVDIGGKSISWWQIPNYTEMEMFRQAMRREVLRGTGDGADVFDLKKLETDAIALNFLYVGHLAESLDSRYSAYPGSKERHNVPSGILSDDLRAVLHPQEKYESKLMGNQEWGHFGRWGIYNVRNALQGIGRGSLRLESAANPGEFWKQQGDVLKVPVCYPRTTIKSFFEETTIREAGRDKPLLEYLERREPIPWNSLRGSEPWTTSYGTIKMPKALRLLDVFKSSKTLIDTRDLREGLRKWAIDDPNVNDIYVRVGYRPETGHPTIPEREFHDIKVWAVYAGLGGVRDPKRRSPTLKVEQINIPNVELWLKNPFIGYLGRNETLTLNGESMFSRLFK